jgi:integrase/recombinase XerD
LGDLKVIARYCPSGERDTGDGHAGGCPRTQVKAALSAAYAADLSVSEVVALKVSDIDSERLLLRIEQGKGRKDRFAMLSPGLLDLLRDWYRIARPTVWLLRDRSPRGAQK